MRERLLPSDDQAHTLWPGPGSVTWRRAADACTLLAAGYALVLQVSHPTVGAGVAEHSDYRQDPWGRLLRTLDFTNTLIYSDPAGAAAVARSLRARHRTIKGVKPDGGRYHALEPDAYAWVWATLFDAVVAAHGRFGSPLLCAERALLWSEWRGLGRLLGLRAGDLPAELAGYERYFEETVADVLQDNDSVRAVLQSLRDPAAPPLPRLLQPAWQLGRLPSTHVLALATVGMLPAVLRGRLGLGWTFAQELELRAIAAATRTVSPLLGDRLRVFGPSYVRWRSRRGSSAHPEAA